MARREKYRRYHGKYQTKNATYFQVGLANLHDDLAPADMEGIATAAEPLLGNLTAIIARAKGQMGEVPWLVFSPQGTPPARRRFYKRFQCSPAPARDYDHLDRGVTENCRSRRKPLNPRLIALQCKCKNESSVVQKFAAIIFHFRRAGIDLRLQTG